MSCDYGYDFKGYDGYDKYDGKGYDGYGGADLKDGYGYEKYDPCKPKPCPPKPCPPKPEKLECWCQNKKEDYDKHDNKCCKCEREHKHDCCQNKCCCFNFCRFFR
ncbi:MAG TPA: hypothetical protein VIL03_02000 [Clostridia bacterium]|jgi:hypothetical protein